MLSKSNSPRQAYNDDRNKFSEHEIPLGGRVTPAFAEATAGKPVRAIMNSNRRTEDCPPYRLTLRFSALKPA